MELITKEQTEEHKIKEVRDGQDYLSYITFDYDRWFAMYGNIDGISFLSKQGCIWVKQGRGKLKQTTFDKLCRMDKFFRG